jgi:sporulation protein YlmC with PRC-barrel domain
MLTNASAINGYAVAASDGQLGTVQDFLFDDASWRVRWLVVDTGGWLSSRRVILRPSVLGHPDRAKREFAVRLTMKEVEDSPAIETDEPVSRQMETNTYDHYGWVPYWGGGLYMRDYGFAGGMASPYVGSNPSEGEHVDSHRNDGDPHLRSIEAVTGYHIHAKDGEVGHVADFLLEEGDWSIHYLVVGTRNWWPGKKVLISPRSARKIDWLERLISLDVDRDTVKGSPVYEASTIVDRAYENHFHSHYDSVALDGQS